MDCLVLQRKKLLTYASSFLRFTPWAYFQELILASMAAITDRFCSSREGLRITGAGFTLSAKRRFAARERSFLSRVEKIFPMTF
jgi:hypothetical protein